MKGSSPILQKDIRYIVHTRYHHPYLRKNKPLNPVNFSIPHKVFPRSIKSGVC